MSDTPQSFVYFYDKGANSGTYWLVVRGEGQALTADALTKLQAQINKTNELSALRFGPSWRQASNGRAYDFWLFLVDRNGRENPDEKTVAAVLDVLGGSAERTRVAPRAALETSESAPEARSRMADLADQVRTLRHALDQAVENAKNHRKTASELSKDLSAAQKALSEREKRVQELEAEVGWISSSKSAGTKAAEQDAKNKERALRGVEQDLHSARIELEGLNNIVARLTKAKADVSEDFRFALENRLDSARLYFAQAATQIFHRLANRLHIETKESGWMKIVRNLLVESGLVERDGNLDTAIGRVHELRVKIIHQNYAPSRSELKHAARSLDAFEAFVLSQESSRAEELLEEVHEESDELPEYLQNSGKRARKASLRDHRKRGRRR